MKNDIELLAPAGNMDSFKAACSGRGRCYIYGD